MYTLKQNPFDIYNFHVLLHESCPLDIHQVSKSVLSELKSTIGPGEYKIINNMVSEITIYH